MCRTYLQNSVLWLPFCADLSFPFQTGTHPCLLPNLSHSPRFQMFSLAFMTHAELGSGEEVGDFCSFLLPGSQAMRCMHAGQKHLWRVDQGCSICPPLHWLCPFLFSYLGCEALPHPGFCFMLVCKRLGTFPSGRINSPCGHKGARLDSWFVLLVSCSLDKTQI